MAAVDELLELLDVLETQHKAIKSLLARVELDKKRPFYLEACLRAVVKAQHAALDITLAMVVQSDPQFRPSESLEWEAVKRGFAAINDVAQEAAGVSRC